MGGRVKIQAGAFSTKIDYVTLDVWHAEKTAPPSAWNHAVTLGKWETTSFFNEGHVNGTSNPEMEIWRHEGERFFIGLRDSTEIEDPMNSFAGCFVTVKEVGKYISGNPKEPTDSTDSTD